MTKNTSSLVAAVWLLLLAALATPHADAQTVPALINYQGKLVNSNGLPVSTRFDGSSRGNEALISLPPARWDAGPFEPPDVGCYPWQALWQHTPSTGDDSLHVRISPARPAISTTMPT